MKLTENENVKIKIVFAHMFVKLKSGSIYIERKPKWSPAHSRHIFEYISPPKMLRFVIFVCNYPKGPLVAAAAWRAPTW